MVKKKKKSIKKAPIKKKKSVLKKKTVRKVKKPVKKVRKKIVLKKTKEDNFVVGFEEVTVKCPSCSREFRVVKSSGFSMEGMLCQRCAAGGGVGFALEDY